MQNDSRDYKVCRALLGQRWRFNDWRGIAKHVMPLLIPDSNLQDVADDGLADVVVQRAKDDVLKLAGVCASMVTERGLNWFYYKSNDKDAAADAEDWFTKATQVVQDAIEQSNFYTEQHSAVVDRIVTGTGLMLIEPDELRTLVFVHVPAGTYAIAENDQQEVDTVVRTFKFTPHQAALKWGLEKLSEKMRKSYESADERYSRQFEIWHLVEPRDVADMGNVPADKSVGMNPLLMSWRSVYMEADSRHVIHEDGYYEFPYLCSRFVTLAGSPYGLSALYGLEDTLRKIIRLEGSIVDAAEAAAIPRLLTSADMVEDICLEAGGITVVTPQAEAAGLPREWATVVDYRSGKELLAEKEAELDKALFIDAIQVLAPVERQMSATEAQLRTNEKVQTFAPTFSQYVADLRRPMERIFAICYRAGLFPQNYVPKSLLSPTEASKGSMYRLNAPTPAYIGRMAKALENNKVRGVQSILELAGQMVQLSGDGGWLGAIKPGRVMHFLGREMNVPVECMEKLEVVEQREEDARVAAAQQQQAQVAQMMASANRDQAMAANS